MNVKWKDLARIDAILTNRFVDSERNISHKLELEETLDKESRSRLKMVSWTENPFEMVISFLKENFCGATTPETVASSACLRVCKKVASCERPNTLSVRLSSTNKCGGY